MKKETQPYTEFVKAVALTVKQFRLYSQDHPIAKQSLETLKQETQKFFESEQKITIGSMRGRLVINGAMASDKEASSRDLSKELDRLHLEGMIIQKGVSIEELSVFLKLLSERSKTFEATGGFKKHFEEKKFEHIKLSHGKFELVEEGQAVAEEEEIGDGPGGGAGGMGSIADIINRIREGKDQPGAEAAQLDCPKIVEQIEKKPKEIVEATLETSEDPIHLESVIRKVVHSLVEGLVSYLVEQGKDITKALDKLSKELEKSLQKIGGGEAFDELAKKIPNLFEEESDELRIQMMLKAFQKDPNDAKAIQKMADKLFKQDDVRDRLKGPVLQELKNAGMADDAAGALFDKIEAKIQKKKSKVTIDADELEELRRKADSYNPDVEAQVKKAVEKVEREKKVLEDEKERVDAVVRNLSEGVLVVDKQGKVVMMNPAAEKLLGVNKNEKIGKAVTEDLKEEHMVSMAKGDLDDHDEDVAKNVEVVSLNDETQKVLQASTAVIENESGKTVGMVSVLSDVTKQKEIEELKTKFVSNVSHELRTPLVAIQKSLSVLLEEEAGEIPDDQKKFLSIATRNMDRLSRLINDLLDISKIESRNIVLLPRQFSLDEVVEHLFETFETWAKDKKVKLKKDFSQSPMEFEADIDRMTQVLTNLISNALKFTPEGGTVCIDAKMIQEKGDSWVEVGVNDTGIGIAPEDQAKIFNKFEQVSLAQPKGVPSTGLGLTITKEIVELHFGEIWVESEPGKGSRFAFKIPARFKPQEEDIKKD